MRTRDRQSIFIEASSTLTDFILPPACLGCQTPLATHAKLCSTCWTNIDFIAPPLCDRLGIPLPFDIGEKAVSPAAIADPPSYDRARAVATYSSVMRELIHDFKYRDHTASISQFAIWIKSSGKDLLSDADLILPVPLYWTRLWTRRFNQSAQLAKALSNHCGIKCNPLVLRRIKRTKSQVGMTMPQRKRNVSGAFFVPPHKRPLIDNKNIVIIDDVITTGATVNACAKVLKRAGAARVDVLALALVSDLASTSI